MRKSRWISIAMFVAVLPAMVEAQDSTTKDAWLSAFSVGFPGVGGDMEPGLFTLGGNFTKIRPGSLTPDFSVGTMPYALSVGLLPLAARAGFALPMQFSADVFIIPSAGLSTVMAMGVGGAGAVFGSNAGIALATKGGARMGITWHRFADSETIMLLEIGVAKLR